MIVVILLGVYLIYGTPMAAVVSALSFFAVLCTRRTGRSPFAVVLREPGYQARPLRWLLAYAATSLLVAAVLCLRRPWSTDPDAGITSQSVVLCAATTSVHLTFLFAYLGWTGTFGSRIL